VIEPTGAWRRIVETAALADPLRAAPLVGPTVAVLEAALDGRWERRLIDAAFDDEEALLLAVLGKRLREAHATLDPQVLDAARAVLRLLWSPLEALLGIRYGGRPPPAQGGTDAPGLGSARAIGETLRELETWTTPRPRSQRYRCPRCGSNAVDVHDEKVDGRHLMEASCDACGEHGNWYDAADDADSWAIER
jgi:hypothetical protein